jgi:hypothetical protein
MCRISRSFWLNLSATELEAVRITCWCNILMITVDLNHFLWVNTPLHDFCKDQKGNATWDSVRREYDSAKRKSSLLGLGCWVWLYRTILRIFVTIFHGKPPKNLMRLLKACQGVAQFLASDLKSDPLGHTIKLLFFAQLALKFRAANAPDIISAVADRHFPPCLQVEALPTNHACQLCGNHRNHDYPPVWGRWKFVAASCF